MDRAVVSGGPTPAADPALSAEIIADRSTRSSRGGTLGLIYFEDGEFFRQGASLGEFGCQVAHAVEELEEQAAITGLAGDVVGGGGAKRSAEDLCLMGDEEGSKVVGPPSQDGGAVHPLVEGRATDDAPAGFGDGDEVLGVLEASEDLAHSGRRVKGGVGVVHGWHGTGAWRW